MPAAPSIPPPAAAESSESSSGGLGHLHRLSMEVEESTLAALHAVRGRGESNTGSNDGEGKESQDARGNERNERKEVREAKQTQEVPQPPEPVVSIVQVRLYTIPKIGVGGCMPVFKVTNGEEEYKSNDFCKPKAMVKVRSKVVYDHYHCTNGL